MYAVSDKYKQAIKSTLKKGYVFGVLNVNGTEYPLNDSNIVKDSLYITNQIVNDSKLCFGAVYAGEFGVVVNSNINRYSLYGAKITLSYSLEIDEQGTLEAVPLGEFFVDEAQRIGSTIKLTAVDAMSNFDKALSGDINGELYDLLKFACDTCGVAMAQTRAEIEGLHSNATGRTYTLKQEHLSTYRDAISYLAMVVCANATIDRFGKLKFVQYATKACDYTDKDSRITNCKFNDYTTRYSCITARFFAEENYAPYSVKDDSINGLILDLGDVPIVGGTPAEKYVVLNAMLDTLKQIVYVPSTLYIPSNPAYDLGDMIECRNVNHTTDSVNMYVMCYSFEYRNKETINCYGENPLLQNIKSSTDKLVSSFENQVALKTMVIVNYTNAEDYVIRQELVDIITLSYVFDLDCRPIVICTIPFTIDVDGYVEFALYDGLVPLTDEIYRGYYQKGEHFATFMYLDNYTKGSRRKLKVLARCYADTTSAVRVHDAQIRALQQALNLKQNIIDYNATKWEIGTIDSSTGEELDSTTRLRSTYVEVKGGKTYKFTSDGKHKLITRLYNADKTYRGYFPSSWATVDFELTTNANDRYIRFILANTDDSTITTDELDNIGWSCEPVLEAEVATVDATEPTVNIASGRIKSIAYTNSGGGVISWDGTLEFTDEFTNIPTLAPQIAQFFANVAIGVNDPTARELIEVFTDIDVLEVRIDGMQEWADLDGNTLYITQAHNVTQNNDEIEVE